MCSFDGSLLRRPISTAGSVVDIQQSFKLLEEQVEESDVPIVASEARDSLGAHDAR